MAAEAKVDAVVSAALVSASNGWHPINPLNLTASQTPSLLFGNLSASRGTLAFVRQNDVVVVHVGANKTQLVQSRSRPHKVFGCHVVELNGKVTVALVSTNGAEFWAMDAPGAPLRLAALFNLESVLPRLPDTMHFVRGLAVLPSLDANMPAHVVLGLSTGQLVLLEVAAQSNSRVVRRLPAHSAAVTTLASGGRLRGLVSACDDGEIIVWSSGLEKLGSLPGGGFPCTGLVMRGHALVASYATGFVRILRCDPLELVAEIDAHSRCVMALHLHPTESLFLTAGEDQYVHVWTLPDLDPDRGSEEVSMQATLRVVHQLPTGAQFMVQGRSSRIVAASYDYSYVHVWERE